MRTRPRSARQSVQNHIKRSFVPQKLERPPSATQCGNKPALHFPRLVLRETLRMYEVACPRHPRDLNGIAQTQVHQSNITATRLTARPLPKRPTMHLFFVGGIRRRSCTCRTSTRTKSTPARRQQAMSIPNSAGSVAMALPACGDGHATGKTSVVVR